MLLEADELAQEFLSTLDQADFLPDLAQPHIQRLRNTFDSYMMLAPPVTMQMIDGDLTDDLLAQAQEMNTTYDDLITQLQQAELRVQGIVEEMFAEARKSREIWQHVMFLSTVIGLGLIVLVSLGVIAATVRPLRRITAATEGIAHGDLRTPLTFESKDELGRLAVSFRKMQSHLIKDIEQREAAEEALRKALNDLELTNEDLKNTNHELRETQAQLVQSEKLASMGRFVAGIAHEFNNPIAAVQSSSMNFASGLTKLEKIVEAEDPGKVPPEAKRVLKLLRQAQEVIVAGGNRVGEIVRRMKNFVRLDEANLQQTDVHTCIEDTLAIFSSEKQPGVTIRKEYGELPKLYCYPAQVNQLLLQLLSNANRAIHGEGEILLRTDSSDGKVRIQVRDTGEGIPRERLGRIFDPGYTTWGVGVGVGLGLTIAHQVVQEHGGSIHVDSEPGKGTSFTILLPIRSAPGQKA